MQHQASLGAPQPPIYAVPVAIPADMSSVTPASLMSLPRVGAAINRFAFDQNPSVQECIVQEDPVETSIADRPLLEWLVDSDAPVFFKGVGVEGGPRPMPMTYRRLIAFLAGESPPVLQSCGAAAVGLLFDACDGEYMALTLLLLLHHRITACPLDSRMTIFQLKEAVAQMKIDCLICGGENNAALCVELSRNFEPNLTVLVARPTGQCVAHLTIEPRLISRGPQQRRPEASAAQCPLSQQPAILLRTSGTTGKPKLVPITTRQLFYNSRRIAASLNLTSTDCSLGVMPLFHIGGIACSLFSVLASNSSMIFCTPFDADLFFDVAAWQYPKPTWYYAVPTIHRAVAIRAEQIVAEKKVSLPSFRFIRSGAAHLPHTDAMKLKELFSCAVLPTYSMSECMPICGVPYDWAMQIRDVVGPTIGPSIRIGSFAAGQPLQYGETGEVLLRGFGVIEGYASGEGAFTNDGFFRTGDTGQLDKNGFLSLHGRAKEVAKYGGEQVSLFEVDQAVQQCPIVRDAVAFAVPNSFWGEEVAVVVVLKDANNIPEEYARAQILDFAKSRLEPFKVPRQVVFIQSASQLPTTGSGKYVRSSLASHFKLSAVDTTAERTMRRTSTNASFQPSKALHGVRVLVALWVVQHHVGDLPNRPWSIIRDFTLSMSIFVILGGISLASATSRVIQPSERIDFYVSRLSAAHPAYILALIYSIPASVLTCFPERELGEGQKDSCTQLPSTPYWVLFVVSQLLAFLALLPPFWAEFVAFNGPIWFQAAYNCLVLHFPSLDAKTRSYPKDQLSCVLLVSVLAATLVFLVAIVISPSLITLTFIYISWVPAFFVGIVIWHKLKSHFDESGSFSSWMWGIITDVTSLCMLLFLVAIVITGPDTCKDYGLMYLNETHHLNITTNASALIGMPNVANSTFENGTLYYYLSSEESILTDVEYERCGSQSMLVVLPGFVRLATPIAVLWLTGLTIGHGLTAKIFSMRVFVDFLGPLAYPLYLLHVPTAIYVWYAFGKGYTHYLMKYPVEPYPLPWYALIIVVAISLVIGALCNEFLVPHLMPISMKYWRFIITKFACVCCGCEVTGTAERIASSSSTETIVMDCIRRLTGNDVSTETELRNIGLDSFGTTALSGALRDAFPSTAANLRPYALLSLRTIGDLVAQIKRADGRSDDHGRDEEMQARRETVEY